MFIHSQSQTFGFEKGILGWISAQKGLEHVCSVNRPAHCQDAVSVSPATGFAEHAAFWYPLEVLYCRYSKRKQQPTRDVVVNICQEQRKVTPC